MRTIYNFCKDTARIYCSTTDIKTINDLKININPLKDEILCSRFSKGNDCIFNFKLGTTATVIEQIEFMKTIELFYRNKFSWRFDGKNIELLGLVRNKEENLGRLSRYKGFDSFIKYLRNRITEILKFRELYIATPKSVDDKIFATGSINNNTNMFVVPILPKYDKFEIFAKANRRIIDSNTTIKELDLGYWIKEINPDYFKAPQKRLDKKYPLTREIIEKYPKCIKKIGGMKKKGNYNRFLLATFLLAVHNERDSKHQLDITLSDEERKHINEGNCKDQWRAILAKEYSPPSCRTMLECGHCKYDCGRAAPSILEGQRGEE